MGLFGGKKEVNVQDLLKKLSETGGDGIFKIPIQVFTKYLHENGELITQSGYNGIEGFLDISKIEKIAKFCEKKNIILFIDEVYFHFNNFSSMQLINKYNNLFVARSFSKAFGLAGVRLGYLISNKKNILYVSKFRSGYECNTLSAAISQLFIDNFHIVKNYITDIKNGSKYLKNELDKLSIDHTGGNYGNFVYIDLKSFSKNNKIINYLKKKNIYVRGGWPPPFDKGFSLTISSKKIMKIFVREFRKAIILY